MVKKTKQKTEEISVSEKKSTGIFQLLLLWVLIPLLFASAVLLIIAQVADFNVFDKASELTKSIPFLKKDEDKEGEANNVVLEERVVSLQAEIQNKEAELTKIQSDLEKANKDKDTLLAKQQELLAEIELLKSAKDDSQKDMKEIISTFESMSAKSAAPVLTNMSDAEAIQILTKLKPDTLASILEKMSPEDAAKYTSLMTK
ncbi:flagellar motility protein MotE (MotC chaperone) [Sporosarcina luteola]|nr:flagellar motility protein MotE (MotC chaperone) [Sporosarcina luteola]